MPEPTLPVQRKRREPGRAGLLPSGAAPGAGRAIQAGAAAFAAGLQDVGDQFVKVQQLIASVTRTTALNEMDKAVSKEKERRALGIARGEIDPTDPDYLAREAESLESVIRGSMPKTSDPNLDEELGQVAERVVASARAGLAVESAQAYALKGQNAVTEISNREEAKLSANPSVDNLRAAMGRTQFAFGQLQVPVEQRNTSTRVSLRSQTRTTFESLVQKGLASDGQEEEFFAEAEKILDMPETQALIDGEERVSLLSTLKAARSNAGAARATRLVENNRLFVDSLEREIDAGRILDPEEIAWWRDQGALNNEQHDKLVIRMRDVAERLYEEDQQEQKLQENPYLLSDAEQVEAADRVYARGLANVMAEMPPDASPEDVAVAKIAVGVGVTRQYGIPPTALRAQFELAARSASPRQRVESARLWQQAQRVAKNRQLWNAAISPEAAAVFAEITAAEGRGIDPYVFLNQKVTIDDLPPERREFLQKTFRTEHSANIEQILATTYRDNTFWLWRAADWASDDVYPPAMVADFGVTLEEEFLATGGDLDSAKTRALSKLERKWSKDSHLFGEDTWQAFAMRDHVGGYATSWVYQVKRDLLAAHGVTPGAQVRFIATSASPTYRTSDGRPAMGYRVEVDGQLLMTEDRSDFVLFVPDYLESEEGQRELARAKERWKPVAEGLTPERRAELRQRQLRAGQGTLGRLDALRMNFKDSAYETGRSVSEHVWDWLTSKSAQREFLRQLMLEKEGDTRAVGR